MNAKNSNKVGKFFAAVALDNAMREAEKKQVSGEKIQQIESYQKEDYEWNDGYLKNLPFYHELNLTAKNPELFRSTVCDTLFSNGYRINTNELKTAEGWKEDTFGGFSVVPMIGKIKGVHELEEKNHPG